MSSLKLEPTYRLPFMVTLVAAIMALGPTGWSDEVVTAYGPGMLRVTLITGVLAVIAGVLIARDATQERARIYERIGWGLLAAYLFCIAFSAYRASYLAAALMLGLGLGCAVAYEKRRLTAKRPDALAFVSIGYGVTGVIILALSFAATIGGVAGVITWAFVGFDGQLSPWTLGAWVAAPFYLIGLVLFTAAWRRTCVIAESPEVNVFNPPSESAEEAARRVKERLRHEAAL